MKSSVKKGSDQRTALIIHANVLRMLLGCYNFRYLNMENTLTPLKNYPTLYSGRPEWIEIYHNKKFGERHTS